MFCLIPGSGATVYFEQGLDEYYVVTGRSVTVSLVVLKAI